MRRDRCLPAAAVLFAVLGAALGGLADRASALHVETPGAVRLTRSATHFHSPGRMWGNDVAFVSNVDLAFNGNNTQQIFVYNHFQWVCQNGTPLPGTEARCPSPPIPFLQQITFGAGEPSNPTVSQSNGTCQLDPNIPCDIDADCGVEGGQCFKDNQWVAFDALGSFAGGTGAQATRRQIFLFNRDTQALIRVTSAVDGDSTHPSVNVQGGIVVFQSTAALTGVPNPSGSEQIFLFERKSGLLRQITFGEAPSVNVTINQGGTMIAFQSRADLLRSGVDTGHHQIFWAEYDKITHTAMVRQLTNGDGDSINPNLGQTSKSVVFESVATNLAGTPGGSQIYRSSQLDTSPITVEQVTFQSAFGDCHYPALSPGADRIVFICDGDPLANGTDGPRAFTLDLDGGTLRQLTGAGQVQGPISHNLGRWFVSLSTTSTLTQEAACGFQLFAIDYYDAEPGHWPAAKAPGELPPDVHPPEGGIDSNVIGKVNFLLQREGAGAPASHVESIQRDGDITAPLLAEGLLPLVIGAPDLATKLNSVRLPEEKISLPPIPVPNVGYLCIVADGDGLGSLDCDGGHMGGTLAITQDHNVSELVDPTCAFGCREGAACQRIWLEGPHQTLCPGECVDAVCEGGFNEGKPCTGNVECRPIDCSGGRYGVCNGPVQANFEGTSRPGEMHINLPVRMTLAREPGIDGVQCTLDDIKVATDLETVLRLTTGGQDTNISDRDNTTDVSLLGERSGAPFDCESLRAGIVLGSQLIGVLPFLDLPTPLGTRDTILQLILDPRIEPNVCDVPCQGPTDCDDGNVCNGTEPCVNSVCRAGTPMVCSDGNPCNGTETCNPVTGCQLGNPIVCTNDDACDGLEECDPETLACLPGEIPDCDDLNPCTADSCDNATGCEHTPVPGSCDDQSACTQGDTCVAGECIGTLKQCTDGNACNGLEECVPATGACVPGVAPVCDNGDGCPDSCDPASGCVEAPCSTSSTPSTPPPLNQPPATGCTNTGIGGLEGALCEIDAILDQLAGPPNGSFRGVHLRRRLSKLAGRARVKVELASRAGNGKAITLLTGADKKLQAFSKKAEKGAGFGRMSDDLMHGLTDRSRTARSIIQGVRALLRGLNPPGGGGR
jgi:Tol biopolymer transport system component